MYYSYACNFNSIYMFISEMKSPRNGIYLQLDIMTFCNNSIICITISDILEDSNIKIQQCHANYCFTILYMYWATIKEDNTEYS